MGMLLVSVFARVVAARIFNIIALSRYVIVAFL
jgi:hypothetical protein